MFISDTINTYSSWFFTVISSTRLVESLFSTLGITCTNFTLAIYTIFTKSGIPAVPCIVTCLTLSSDTHFRIRRCNIYTIRKCNSFNILCALFMFKTLRAWRISPRGIPFTIRTPVLLLIKAIFVIFAFSTNIWT